MLLFKIKAEKTDIIYSISHCENYLITLKRVFLKWEKYSENKITQKENNIFSYYTTSVFNHFNFQNIQNFIPFLKKEMDFERQNY